MIKILILQPEFMWKYPSSQRLKINKYGSSIVDTIFSKDLKKIINTRLFSYTDFPITSEMNHYGDLSSLNNCTTYALERYHPVYFEREPLNYPYIPVENYPSNFGYKKPNFLSYDEIFNSLSKFNAIICSIKCGKKIRPLLIRAKNKNVPVFLFDNIDHEDMYLNILTDPYRGFKEFEFDYYFKKDIPLFCENDKLIPIAPVPAKLDNITNSFTEWDNRSNDLFFIGSHRKNLTRDDRLEVSNLLNSTFNKSNILINKDYKIKLSDYDNQQSDTKIIFSPAGRVWCSYRHVESARFNSPVLLPMANCKTVGIQFKDQENCLTYDTKLEEGKFKLKNQDILIDKLNYILNNKNKALEIAKKYRSDMLHSHTTIARSKYILDQIIKKINVT
jgi:hypothetical protein